MSEEKTVQPEPIAKSPDLAPGHIAASAEQAKLFADGRPKKHTMTFGKRMHWLITYAGADWLLNSAVGVAFAFVTARTEIGQRLWSKRVEGLFKGALSPFIKNPDILQKSISGGKDFLSIMVGGSVINPLITRLESHATKKRIAKFFDRMMHGSFAVENDPYFKQAYEQIDNEPLKDRRGVWISRAMAIAPLFLLSFSTGGMKFLQSTDKPVIKHVNLDNIARFTKHAANKIAIKPKRWMLERQMDSTRGVINSNWEALHNYVAFDYGLTVFYALLHAITFGLVAKKLERRGEIREILQEYKREHPRSEPAGAHYETMEQLDRSEETPNAPGVKISGIEVKTRLDERGIHGGLQI